MSDLNNTPIEHHAWFSKIQKDRLYKYCMCRNPHTNIYLTTDGKEVEVTEICNYKDTHEERFKDSQYLGKVVKWLRVHNNSI